MTSYASNLQPIRIGVLADEPVRVAGLASIFDQPAQEDQPQLVPVVGSLPDLLGSTSIEYIVIDFYSSLGSLEILETIRRDRPEIRSIVIGPEGDDELVLNSIIAGARAYLGQSAESGGGSSSHRRGYLRLHLGAAASALPRDRPAA